MGRPRKYAEGCMMHRRKMPTPLKLKRLIFQRGISAAELTRAMRLHTGEQPSFPTVSQILNRDIWPTQTPKSFLKKQITDFLASRGVAQDDLNAAFDIDEDPEWPVHTNRQAPGTRPRLDPAPFTDGYQLPEAEMLSQLARQHFQLFRDPFVDDVQKSDDVFLSTEQRYIREAMFTTARHGGFLAVIGESGAGKTTLRRDLIDRIARESLPISVIQPRIIDKGRLTAGAICDAIIRDVSLEAPKGSLEAKGRQIERLLTASGRAGNHHVLIIEEAHDLSVQTLKYLKRFWELEDGFRKLLAILLVGQPELKNKLDERQNWEAREVIRRCEIAELKPLNGDLEEYLALKFQRVGKDLESLFERDAFDAIRTRLTFRSRGTDSTVSMHYPLVVNNLVTKALNLAAQTGEKRVSADVIREV